MQQLMTPPAWRFRWEMSPFACTRMDADAVQFQQDGSDVLLHLQSFTGTLRVARGVVCNSNQQARRRLAQNSEEATRITGPQNKTRKGNPKEPGCIDNENHALLLKAMKVFVKKFDIILLLLLKKGAHVLLLPTGQVNRTFKTSRWSRRRYRMPWLLVNRVKYALPLVFLFRRRNECANSR